jgi:hypothetical protein
MGPAETVYQAGVEIRRVRERGVENWECGLTGRKCGEKSEKAVKRREQYHALAF